MLVLHSICSMTDHPITPPPKPFKQWEDDILNERDNVDHVLHCVWRHGFHAGADQELEACCEWLCAVERWKTAADRLRSNRRPKPPSLKEQALDGLRRIETNIPQSLKEFEASCDVIRRALEALDD